MSDEQPEPDPTLSGTTEWRLVVQGLIGSFEVNTNSLDEAEAWGRRLKYGTWWVESRSCRPWHRVGSLHKMRVIEEITDPADAHPEPD